MNIAYYCIKNHLCLSCDKLKAIKPKNEEKVLIKCETFFYEFTPVYRYKDYCSYFREKKK